MRNDDVMVCRWIPSAIGCVGVELKRDGAWEVSGEGHKGSYEAAIATAIGNPDLRFASQMDESEVLIAASRRRRVKVIVRKGEIHSLGIA